MRCGGRSIHFGVCSKRFVHSSSKKGVGGYCLSFLLSVVQVFVYSREGWFCLYACVFVLDYVSKMQGKTRLAGYLSKTDRKCAFFG